MNAYDHDRVALLGMAGRFPGAPDVTTMWERSLVGQIDIVPVGSGGSGGWRGVVGDTDRFDAAFFGIPPKEAALIDPQQRLLLELVQHGFDDAGLDPDRIDEPVSVYLACGPASSGGPREGSLSARYEHDLASSSDFAATRVSYRFDLRGESMTVQTGCSSSLVAVHLAVQSLLDGRCDVAVAGGASFPADQDEGYIVEEGMITSPSGRCLPFEARADGAVPGGGGGVVILAREDDALRWRSRIRAFVIGSGLNNDGATKAGFMAPSPIGQAEAIVSAHSEAGIAASTVGYVETHGTATPLGDAVEIEGLRRAFARGPRREHPCALGSFKANVGHLDRAAGIAGLIRAVLAVESGVLPPMAGFADPNPELDLSSAGFVVPTEAEPWPDHHAPRRAGVSSFGVGGTNAHMVLEQPPRREPTQDSALDILLPLSAHNPESLGQAAEELAERLADGVTSLADVAHTLAVGRSERAFRAYLVAADAASAAVELRRLVPPRRPTGTPSVVFVFPGQGEPVVNGMGELYDTEPVFREAVEDCARRIVSHGGGDVLRDLYGESRFTERVELFRDMGRFQPALFAVEWGLAELLRSWGVTADAVIGHSVGELVAATYAGVLDLDDALALVVTRGAAMQATRPGRTLSVPLSIDQVRDLLTEDLNVATVNGPQLVSVTGTVEATARLEAQLAEAGLSVAELDIHRMPHGPAMADAARVVRRFADTLNLRPPQIPLLSNVSGAWVTSEMSDPGYWGDHLLSPVRFDREIARLDDLSDPQVVVVGPTAGLSRIIAQQRDPAAREVVACTSRADECSCHASVLEAVGRIWSAGVPIRIPALIEAGGIVSLPSTSFNHSRRWPMLIEEPSGYYGDDGGRRLDPGSWLYEPHAEPLSSGRTRRPVVVSVEPFDGARGSVAVAVEKAAQSAGIPFSTRSTLDDGSNETTSVTDVLWWIGDRSGDVLNDGASIAEAVSRVAPGARLWPVVRGADDSQGPPTPSDVALAAGRVLPQEYPGVSCHLVRLGDGDPAEVGAVLLSLLERADAPSVLDVEGAQVTELSFVSAWPDWRARPLRPGGCYVVTGGLGLVGRSLVRAILREVEAWVIVLGRRGAIEATEAIACLRDEVADLKGSVEYRQVDVTDRAAMTALLGSLRSRFGRVDGVVHAAGFTDRAAFPLIQDADAEMLARISAAKNEGVAAINAALEDTDADFVLLCSSLSVVLGGVRFAPYVAANCALDDFARRRHAAGDSRWISVAWDAWDDSESASDTGPARYALRPEDGWEVFRRALAARGPVLLVSTGDLRRRILEVNRQVRGDASAEHAAEPVADEAVTVDPIETVERAVVDVLGATPTSRSTDLRTEGLESLGVLQLVHRVRANLGVTLPVAVAMRNLTLDGLVREVLTRTGSDVDDTASGSPPFVIRRVPPADEYPTSSTQRRWLELLDEGFGGIDLPIEILGPVETRELAVAVRRVIERHSGLRTVFRQDGAGWVQTIRPATDVPVRDLTGEVSTTQREHELERLVDEFGDRWFDVASEPPFETVLVKMADDRHVLVIHAHHMLFDGWSSSVFMHDIDAALNGTLGGEPYQYVDYATAQTEYLGSTELERIREHWRGVFEGAKGPTEIPGAARDPADRGDMLEFGLDAERTRTLNDLAVDLCTTTFCLLMLAFGVMLRRLTDESDLIVGTTAAGRGVLQADEIVGVFVNPLPLRLDVDLSRTVREQVEHIHNVLVDFHEYGHYPIEDLVNHVEPFLGRGLNDTFSCYLLYQNYWRAKPARLEFQRLQRESAPSHHKLMRDLEIVLEDRDGTLQGEMWFRRSRYSRESARKWRTAYVRLLESLTGKPGDLLDAPVSELLAEIESTI